MFIHKYTGSLVVAIILLGGTSKNCRDPFDAHASTDWQLLVFHCQASDTCTGSLIISIVLLSTELLHVLPPRPPMSITYMGGFPKLGLLFAVPINKDSSIAGSILGSPIQANYHVRTACSSSEKLRTICIQLFGTEWPSSQ